MKYCRNCGKPIEGTWAHCPDCGEKITPPTLPKTIYIESLPADASEVPVSTAKQPRPNYWWIVVVALVLAALAFSILSRGGSNTTSAPVDAGNDAATMCQVIGDIHSNYNSDFAAFRSSPDDGSGWAPLQKLTEKYKSQINAVIATIETNGITWDSSSIVISMLNNTKAEMNLIVTSALRGYFSPGNDLPSLQANIDIYLNSVTNSACK